MATPIVHARQKSKNGLVLCPYCRAEVVTEDRDVATSERGSRPWRCGRCQTLHHTACAEENHGCTLFGCGGKVPSARPRRRSPTPATAVPAELRVPRRSASPSAGTNVVLLLLCVAARLGLPLLPRMFGLWGIVLAVVLALALWLYARTVD